MYQENEIKEYRDIKEGERSTITTTMQKQGKDQRGILRKFELLHFTEGFVLAGSCARYQQEKYLVRYVDKNGTSYGQYWESKNDALNDFHEKTKTLI